MWALSLLLPIPLAGSDSDPGGDPADSPWHVCLTIASAAAGKSSRREIEEGWRRSWRRGRGRSSCQDSLISNVPSWTWTRRPECVSRLALSGWKQHVCACDCDPGSGYPIHSPMTVLFLPPLFYFFFVYRRSPQPGLIIVYLRIKVTALWLCPTWLLFHNSAAHCVPLHFPRRVLACTGTRSRCPWAAQNDPLSVSIVVLRCKKIRLANPKEFTQPITQILKIPKSRRIIIPFEMNWKLLS